MNTSLSRVYNALQLYLHRRGLCASSGAPSPAFTHAVCALSDAFTRERATLPRNYFSAASTCDAYLALLVPINIAKISFLLDRCQELLPADKEVLILDIGCGPGTALIAASLWLQAHRPHQTARFIGIDANEKILDHARRLTAEFLPSHHRAELTKGDAQSLPRALLGERADMTIAANVFNEIESDKDRLATCRTILAHSASLIIVDPALKSTSRDLMALRDELVTTAEARAVAPCTHYTACPMRSANDRDWCHFYIEWERPQLTIALDRATDLDHRHLKLSYLVLTTRNAAPSENVWRVVSAPLNSKGKTEFVLCGEGRLRRIRRLDKHCARINDDFGHAMRGDVVQLRGDRDSIGVDDAFEIVERFNERNFCHFDDE